MWSSVRLWFWRFLFWLCTPPETDVCYENCPDGTECEECAWWRAIG